MNLTQLVTYIGIIALILTAGIVFYKKSYKNLLVSYFQNFCGVLFIFSGWVKAVDPLGTSYKLEQYFNEFYLTFDETWLSFLAPLFPFLSKYSLSFSIIMIVFEIVLGIMLIIGDRKKFTSWAFLILVAFFTLLTGFTFLTGYVPSGSNFFDFGSWAAYNANNMRVTDCGCFGDFIKLEPRTSFFKDVFLLLPALLFVWKKNEMHDLFTSKTRNIIVGLTSFILLAYTINFSKFNLPQFDFRPFKSGADVASIKEAEMESAANVEIVAWPLKNKKSGEIVKLSNADFMKNFKDYPKEEWEYLEQEKTEPLLKATKISEFEIQDFDGNDVSYEYLEGEQPNFMIVCHKAYFNIIPGTKVVIDTTYAYDTVVTENTLDTTVIKRITSIEKSEKETKEYVWDVGYMDHFEKVIKPLAIKAEQNGMKTSIVIGGIDKDTAKDFELKSGINAEYYTADDILLKTIVRSNPGIVLWKDGKIVNKWHHGHFPGFDKAVTGLK
jgi:uncharacterized membrane protein YphA (DoxX/SURF4 family)